MSSPYEEGNPANPILVLAEAPGYQEIKEGRPLVGPGGEVFNDCLHVAGVARRQCYILNVWPYQVHKDKKTGDILDSTGDLLFHHTKGFTELGWAEAQDTIARIQHSSANVIVPMGQPYHRSNARCKVPSLNPALYLCLGQDKKRPIMKYRGSPLPGQPYLSCRGEIREVIPTVHPAATLHGTYLWRYLIISDLEKALRHSEAPGVIVPKRHYLLEPTLPDVLDYLEACRRRGRVCTDLEVINHQVSCFSLAYKHSEAMCVPLHGEGMNPYWTLEEEQRIWLEYARLLEDERITKINQNLVGFDAVFLFMVMNIQVRGFLGDPMIAQHIMYPEFNKGLDFILSVHTDEPYYKDEGKMWKTLTGDIETFWTYNAKDAATALEAWEVLAKEMTEGGYWPTYNMTVRLSDPLCFMSDVGVRVNREGIEASKVKVAQELLELEQGLRSIAECDFNPSSPAQCARYFYETKGYAPYKNASGGVTTDDKALARIVRKYNSPEARLVQRIRALRKLRGTYLDIALDKDNRLRCSWNPRGTYTGRLSSSSTIFGTGANMQNLHPMFLNFIEADPE